MIDQAQINQLEEAIDSFEENWSASSRDGLIELLRSFHLQDDLAALTELVRVDIELRYKNRLSPEPEEYFKVFPQLETDPECVALIAFEDFRARTTHGHSLSPARWQNLPGVRDEVWFRQLQETPLLSRGVRASVSTSKVKGLPQSDPAFEQELEDAGFRLVHEIGQGAFSRVYLAIQHDLADRYVVLKVVNEALAEPQSLAMLQHTNIVPIYSFHEILKRSVICMPYAGSVTLEQFLANRRSDEGRAGESLVMTVRNRAQESTVADSELQSIADSKPVPLTPAANEKAVLRPLERLQSLDCGELAIWVFQRLASALAHSHARGVLHGDLKPANVLIRNDGEPALLDFNLSQTLDRSKPKFFGGTLPYMPPEALRILMGQKGVEQGVASDIYGLGMMLFEFVTGRLAFPAPPSMAPADLQLAVQTRTNTKPDWNEGDQVSESLRAIIDRCIQPDPKQRYAAAEELQQDLECEQANLPLRHASEPKFEVWKKWARRHPRLLSGGSAAFIGGLLLLLLGAAAVSWRNESLAMKAQESYEQFEKESAAHLIEMFSNSTGIENNGVSESLDMANAYGLVEGVTVPFGPASNEESTAKRRDVVLRHLIHSGFRETQDLRQISNERELDSEDLERLTKIRLLAKGLAGDKGSRGLVWLDSQSAQLAGDVALANKLRSQAEDMPIDSLGEKYLEAIRVYFGGNWKQAEIMLTELADQNAVHSVIRWTALGQAQRRSKQDIDAALSFSQAIGQEPNSAHLYLLRGMAYESSRRELALSDFNTAIELDPDSGLAYYRRALIYLQHADALENGFFEKGLADFDRALTCLPGKVDILLSRARAYRRAGRQDDAEADFQAALKLTDLQPMGYYMRATARRRLKGDVGGAIKDLEIAEKLDPTSPVIKIALAQNYHRLDMNRAGIAKLTELLKQNPASERAYADRAVLHAYEKDFHLAKRDVEDALLRQRDPRTLYQLACACGQMPNVDDKARGLSFLVRAIQDGYLIGDSLENDPDLTPLRALPKFRAIRTVKSLAAITDTPSSSPMNQEPRN